MSFSNTKDAIDHFTKVAQEIVTLEKLLKEKVASYKKETREFFGVADGEPINLVQLSSLVLRLTSAEHKHDKTEIEGAAV